MPLVSLDDLVARIPDGAKLAVPTDGCGVAMAATRALIRRGVRDLHLVCVPVSGLQADLLLGAGCVSVIETSAVSLGEFGAAPRFTAAARERSVKIVDGTCPAIYAGLQAGQKGIPFMPLRGIVESDLLANRDDWKLIDNPFAPGDRIVAIRAIVPDLALFHARAADRDGNVFIGRDRDGLLLAHASRAALITVEEIVDGNLLEDPARAGSVVPSMYASAVAHAPGGAWPVGFADHYGPDAALLATYAREARTEEGFRQCLQRLLETEALPA